MVSTFDMAYELAEYDFLHMPIQYLLDAYTDQWQDGDDLQKAMDKGWKNLLKEWTSRTEADIQAAYAKLITTEEYNNEM
jgi:hypothetical protein